MPQAHRRTRSTLDTMVTPIAEEETPLSSSSSTDIESFHDDEKSSSAFAFTSSPKGASFPRGLPSPLFSRSRISSRQFRILLAFSAVILTFGWLLIDRAHLSSRLAHPFSKNHIPAARRFQKPKNGKVIGLVFFGRRDRSAILDCYLKNNLVSSGGWLDEVVWAINTDNIDDLAWLDDLLPTTPEYRKVIPKKKKTDNSFSGLWNDSVSAGNIYIKLDDDVAYIDDDAIPLVVNTLVTNTESLIVSANMVNSPELNWLQYRTGAILPYLPDLNYARPKDISSVNNPRWRASELPEWIGPADFHAPESRDDWNDYIKSLVPRPQYEKEAGDESEEWHHELPLHRWLPVKGKGAIAKTPISQTENGAFGGGWWSWAIAAQQHYSFFDNLERGRKNVYYISHGSDEPNDAIWDNTGDRISINFLALRGETVLDNMKKLVESENDEVFFSEDLPRLMNRSEFLPNDNFVRPAIADQI